MDYECALWSCIEAVGHSQAHDALAQEEGNVVVIVGGMYERRVNEVASKCLHFRAVGRPCGVSFLPVAALETNPWLQSDTFFNRELEEGEAERNWIFYGPLLNSPEFRSVWGIYETKVVRGFGMTRKVYYLQPRQRSTANGMFRLTAYPVTGIQPEVFYILLFKPSTVPRKSSKPAEDNNKEIEILVSHGDQETDAKFLQEKAKGMAKEVQHSRTGEATPSAEDLAEFLDEVPKGQLVQNDEMLGFAKLFSDELTSDNIISSRAFTVEADTVRATLSSLPDKVVGITFLPSQDPVSEQVLRKLEHLEMKDKLIKKEEVLKDGEDDKVLQEVLIIPPARARALVQQDDLCKLSRALGVLASASSVCREREEFLRLVKKDSDEVAEANQASSSLMA